MKVTKFFFGNGVEILTDNELKATRGGTPNWAECCECTFTVKCSDGSVHNDSGTICGNYGDSDCTTGLSKLAAAYGTGCYIENLCFN